MIYFALLVLTLLVLYVYLVYKNRGFFLYSRYGLPYVFLFIAFLISFTSLFSYQIDFNKKTRHFSSDIFFVLDVSSSMNALDYGNESRLGVAKKFISNYVLNNPTNRYGLTIFAGDSVDLIPLTTDKNLFMTFLESADDKSILKGGTNLLSALDGIDLRFSDSPNGGAIVLISDFETNLDSVSKKDLIHKVNNIAKELAKKNIKLILLGVGDESGNKIVVGNDLFGNPIYKKDKFNNVIITKFDKDLFNSFSLQKYKIDSTKDIHKIDFKDVPASSIELDKKSNLSVSRYLMMVSFLFFLGYLVLFNYFDRKGIQKG